MLWWKFKRVFLIVGYALSGGVQDVVNSHGYFLDLLCNTRGCMCSTDPFKSGWSRCICNSSYYHSLYVTSSYPTWIFCRGVSGFATDCPCGVWCRGLTTCLLPLAFFCILTYAIIYVLIHHIIFRLYLYFLNIVLYFFKYSCTNIFHRRSLYSFYHQIESINLSNYCHVFPSLCLRWHCHHILSISYSDPGKTGYLFPVLLCSLRLVQIIEYIIAWYSESFIFALHYPVIIIMQAWLNALQIQNACHLHSVECVSKI